MIGFFPIPFLIGLSLLALLVFRLWWKKRSLSHLLVTVLFGLYLLLLIDAVIFYIPTASRPEHILTIQNIKFTLSKVNLIPFYFGNHLSSNYLFTQIFYNILLTIPFGFGINFLVGLHPRNILWIAAATGCTTEVSQLLVSIFIVGGPYRSVDINDVLLNAGGVLLGYGIFHITVRWIHPRPAHS